MRKEPEPQTDYLAQLGYETRDVTVRPLFLSVIGLFVFVGFSSVVALLLYLFLTPGVKDAETTGLSPSSAGQLPPDPHPRLQGFPIQDMIKFRQEEDEKLNHYGWVNQAKGTVRIPVDRAIELTAERGLPEFQGTAADLDPNRRENQPKPVPGTPGLTPPESPADSRANEPRR